MSPRVAVVVGSRAAVDRELLRRVLARAAERAGWVLVATDAPDTASDAAPDAVVEIAGSGDPVGQVAGRPLLRVELDASAPELDVAQVRGHGLDTLWFPVSDWLRGLARPADRIRYGTDRDQWLDVRRPAGTPAAIAVLVHGGFYRSLWDATLMNGIAADLADQGWLAVNLEYGRPDRVGWEATVADVRAGFEAARQLDPTLPVALFGHSAGGQLVLQLVESLPEPDRSDPAVLAVSMAGVVDLPVAHSRFMGEDAVRLALGGAPDEVPERYAAASPAGYRARRASWLLVQGTDDSLDLQDMNLRLSRADHLGRPELIVAEGDHFAVIDPASRIWRETERRASALLR
ncbi:alpha/beta hydrolase [Nocardioides sp. LHD-245]|uniref:alpha/beta hydrolase n=1 Tax=Nocardioides sp. LHD-245 TaxID=3051387 RepID=UPI0027E03189|nr:alpha/beta hydrolase [Nocardioides sp. LHD-245]